MATVSAVEDVDTPRNAAFVEPKQPAYKVRRKGQAPVVVTADQLANHPVLTSPKMTSDSNGNMVGSGSTEELFRRLENL